MQHHQADVLEAACRDGDANAAAQAMLVLFGRDAEHLAYGDPMAPRTRKGFWSDVRKLIRLETQSDEEG